MKKYLFFLVFVLVVPNGIMAQGWLNRMADEHRRNAQRIAPHNNRRTYHSNQGNDRRVVVPQSRRVQETNADRVEPVNNTSPSEVNNTSPSEVNDQVQSNDKVVTLVVNGTGQTKEEATRNALRSAIEQAFGTFVSANTEVLNDELIKDEIVTVSSGNIVSYKELSLSENSGVYDVSVQAVVSIDRLTKFAQSKGMQAELAGASFVMNMKMRELNRKNELAAIDHMIEKAMAIARNGLFDYKLVIGEPTLTNNSRYAVKLRVLFCENANTIAFYNTIYKTLQALSLSEKEQQEYKDIGLKVYRYNAQFEEINYGKYALRNRYPDFLRGHSITLLLPIVVENALNYEINDNLGNQYYCIRRTIKPARSSGPLSDYIKKGNGCCEWYYLDEENQTLRFYELRPQNRIARVNHGYDASPAIPLMDFSGSHNYGAAYRGIWTDVSFNPTIDNYGNEKKVSNPERIYYYQEFLVLYTEEELSKLSSITIDHH